MNLSQNNRHCKQLMSKPKYWIQIFFINLLILLDTVISWYLTYLIKLSSICLKCSSDVRNYPLTNLRGVDFGHLALIHQPPLPPPPILPHPHRVHRPSHQLVVLTSKYSTSNSRRWHFRSQCFASKSFLKWRLSSLAYIESFGSRGNVSYCCL